MSIIVCISYGIHIKGTIPTTSTLRVSYGQCRLLFITQSFIQLNGIECKQFCVLFASKQTKGGKPLPCDYIFFFAFSIYNNTEALFIHQSSHFSQFILPLQVNNVYKGRKSSKRQTNTVLSKEIDVVKKKTNIKGVL